MSFYFIFLLNGVVSYFCFHFICSLFENELQYVDKLIAADLRNNSAWNQRYFVLTHTGFTPEVLSRETNYVMSRIRIVKNNESTWNFLRGLLQNGEGTLDQFQEVSKSWFTQNIIQKTKSNVFIFKTGGRIL